MTYTFKKVKEYFIQEKNSFILISIYYLKALFSKYSEPYYVPGIVEKIGIVYFFTELAVQIRDSNLMHKPMTAYVVTVHLLTPTKENRLL